MRDLRGHQQRPQSLALAVARRARAAGVQRAALAEGGPADAQRRHEADEQRRDDRQAEAERHDPRVDGDAAEAGQHGRRHERQRDRGSRGGASTTPSAAPTQRQHDRLRQQLAHDAPASRAESHADGQLAAARAEPRHLQVRDVDAGDQEHERHRPEEDQQQQRAPAPCRTPAGRPSAPACGRSARARLPSRARRRTRSTGR